MVYFNFKDTKHHHTIFALLHDFGVPLSMVKKAYVIQKMKIMFIIEGVVILVSLCLSMTEASLFIAYFLLVATFYLVSLLGSVLSFSTKNMANVFKENKD